MRPLPLLTIAFLLPLLPARVSGAEVAAPRPSFPATLPEPAIPSIHREQRDLHPYDPRTMDRPVRSLPAAAGDARPNRIVYGYLPYWIEDTAVVRWGLLTHLAYFSVDIGPNGRSTSTSLARLTTPRFRQLEADAAANGVKLVVTFTNFDRATIAQLVGSLRQTTIASIVSAVKSSGAQGANVDFELPPSTARANFAAFMNELTTRLHAEVPGSHVTFAAPAIDWSGAFDYASLLANTDGAMVMAYGCSWKTSQTAGPQIPLARTTTWGRCSLTSSVDDIVAKGGAGSNAKVIAGLPWYGYEWPTGSDAIHAGATGSGTARFSTKCESRYALNPRRWDSDSQSPFTAWRANGSWRQLWCDDADSFDLKVERVVQRDLAGIGIWALGYEGAAEAFWASIRARLTGPQTPVDPPDDPPTDPTDPPDDPPTDPTDPTDPPDDPPTDPTDPPDDPPTDPTDPPTDPTDPPTDPTDPPTDPVDPPTDPHHPPDDPPVDDPELPPVLNRAPTAVASALGDRLVGGAMTLDGSPSFDPDRDELMYRWMQREGPTVVLTAQGSSATFVAAEPGLYAFRLVVSDGELLSNPLDVVLEVADAGGGGGDAGSCSAAPVSALALLGLLARSRRRR